MSNLKKLVQGQKWKVEQGIIIPERFIKISALDVSTAVYITHQDITGERFTEEKLISYMSQLSVEDCLISISKILTILENDGYFSQKAQQGLIASMFQKDIGMDLIKRLKNDRKLVVFSEQQLLVLAKYAILYGKEEAASSFNNQALTPVFTEAILGLSDLLVDDKAEDWTEEQLKEYTLRNMYFMSQQHFLNAITRIDDIFIRLPKLSKLKKHPQYLDLDKYFQEATGLSLQDYFCLGFSLIGLVAQQKAGAIKDDYWGVNPKKHFANSKVSKKEVDAVMAEFSITTKELKKIFQSNKDSFEYNFKGLRQHPLVTFSGKQYFPLSLRFMKEKIFLQTYWILFDHIQAKYGDNLFSRYTNFMGAVFEEYVHTILKRMYPSGALLSKRLYREIEYKVGKVQYKSIDELIINVSSLILIETKISHLKVYKSGILGELGSYKEDIYKIVTKAFFQIQRTKRDIEAESLKVPNVSPKDIKIFYPVIVVYDRFPQFPLLWSVIKEELLKIDSDLDKSLLDRLQIIEADELEKIEILVAKTGLSFEEILKNKINDKVYKELPFRNYFYYEFSKYRGEKNEHIAENYRVFANKVTLKLFGKRLKKEDLN